MTSAINSIATTLPITKIGVVGAGTMGSAIAQHFIMKGLSVTLVDQSDAYIERGLGHIKHSLAEAKARRIVSEQQYHNMLANLTTSSSQAALAHCDLVVEAVFEDLSIKKTLFAQLENVVSTACILASNTSSFLVADIASELAHPERMVGVHYFYHAAKNKLIEVIPSKYTAGDITQTLMDFYRYVDKTPILVADAPGFAVNRFFVPWLNEAVRLLEEGRGSIKDIDTIACDVFGVGMGPFALMNATGVPIAQHAAQGLADKLGAFYAPAKLLVSQVASGKAWPLDDESLYRNGKNDSEVIKQRLIGATLGVAAQMVSEGVVDATSADLGARSGLRWPMGPFELMNKLSFSRVIKSVEAVFSPWQMPMPTCLSTDDTASTRHLHWVTSQVCGNAGFIEFNLPDKMNPLSPATMAQFNECFEQLNQNDAISKIFILGQGKAFIAGADIKFFLDAMASDQLESIQAFTEFGQQVLTNIGNSTKQTYAYLDGLALGGGFELALACDYRIGTPKTVIGFPETGIGIYPGLGGTQRTSRLIGVGAAKYLIATGQFLNAEKAYQLGLVDQVIAPVFTRNELACFELSKAQSGLDQDALAAIDFSDFTGKLSTDLWSKTKYQAYEKQLLKKAPIALTMAMSLIEQGAKLPLARALQLELAGLKDIFSTQDASTGLASILSGTKPDFVGA